MAGDWIPYSIDLPRKREVAVLSRLTRLSRREVVGVLLEFWGWASNETTDGFLRGVALDQLPDIVPGTKLSFWQAMTHPDVVWLCIHEDGIQLPNADSWITRGAKARLKERDKKRTQRSRLDGDKAGTIPGPNRDTSRDKSGTESGLQNRTEKKKNNNRATRLPDDFVLDDVLMQYAVGKGVPRPSIAVLFEAFREHHRAKGTRLISWPAGWHTWVLNEIKWHPEKYRSQPTAAERPFVC